jgi:phosphoenolpyruvate synthase
MKYTKRFDEIGKDDVALAGGKGANLGEMSRAGLPVPAGFVLTTGAYDAFVEANDIRGAIVELASTPEAEDPAAFKGAARKIGDLFSGGEVPGEMAEELRAAYEKLNESGEAAVAVRSSATAEDLAGASFAGQQETYLNVRGTEALAEAVKRCWDSLWTARAMAYRKRQDIAPESVSLAVVIQEMVEAEAAGVMFTANPANGRREQAAISAAWGLGESVVSGSVSPDSIVVEKDGGRIVSRETADKEVMTVYTGGGTEERPVPQARRKQPVLGDERAVELARYGSRIEEHYGSPQDIEWAFSGSEFFIVQSRPITALPEPMADPPTDWDVPYPKGMYVRGSIVEQMPDPLTPLFADMSEDSVPLTFDRLIEDLLGPGTLREGDVAFPTINGYAYLYIKTAAGLRLLSLTFKAYRLLVGSGDEKMGVPRWRVLVACHTTQSANRPVPRYR